MFVALQNHLIAIFWPLRGVIGTVNAHSLLLVCANVRGAALNNTKIRTKPKKHAHRYSCVGFVLLSAAP